MHRRNVRTKYFSLIMYTTLHRMSHRTITAALRDPLNETAMSATSFNVIGTQQDQATHFLLELNGGRATNMYTHEAQGTY